MKHREEALEAIGTEISSPDNTINVHSNKMDVLSEMSTNILSRNKAPPNTENGVDDVACDLKNIKLDNLHKNNNDDNNNNNNNNNNDNSNISSVEHKKKKSDKESVKDKDEGPGDGEGVRRKSKRLKKIRIEQKKQRKEARSKIKVEVKDTNSQEKTENKDDETAVISLDSIVGLPHFIHIEENIYQFSRDKIRKNKIPCDCTLTREEKNQGLRGCEEGCLNRMLLYECSSNCPVGKRCANKRFQKKEYAKIMPFKTEKKGWGLMAMEDIDVNVFIMEYVGEVIDAFDFHDRVEAYAAENIQHYYFMTLRKDEIIDSTKKGNITRFINHSCDPNCVTQKWVTNSGDRIGFFSIKPIKKGEELTFDYQFQRYGEKAQVCYCGTERCRGYIGNTKSGPNILTDGTKIDEKLQAELDNEQEQNQEDIIEEIYQMYHEDGIDNSHAVRDIMKVIVQSDLTNPYLQAKIISVLLATKAKTYLKLFVDYRCLIFVWYWMKDTKDLSLKIDCLKLLKILPLDNRTILDENKVFSLVEQWSKNPRSKNDDIVENGDVDGDTENEYIVIQELSQELIKNWRALPEAAKIPKSLKIKMRKSDEQKAMNEDEMSNKKELNTTRRKEIREKLRKSRKDKSSFSWSTHSENNHIPAGSNGVPLTEEEYLEQEKAKLEHRKKFEQKIAEHDYAEAMKRYGIEIEQWMDKYGVKEASEVSKASSTDISQLLRNAGILTDDKSQVDVQALSDLSAVQDGQISETAVSEEKPEIKPKKIDFLLESFDLLNVEDENNELDEGISFIDFNDHKFSAYRHIYDHRTIFIKSDFEELLNTKPNLTVLTENDDEFESQILPPEYIDIAPINDITYESDDIFESMDKTIFDATYPYHGAYINLNSVQYMQGVRDSNGPDIVCKEILAKPLPVSFTKNKLPQVPRPWKIRKTEDGHYFYYNPIKMFTQWSHPLVDPSENVSLNEIESALNGTANAQNNIGQTSNELSAEQLRRNKLNNSIILKKAEQRTKERLERQKKREKEAILKKEEEVFRLVISKYVVKCLNPHLSTKDKKRKIQTKEEFKKIAEKFTNRIVQIEMPALRSCNRKLTLTDGIKFKIKQKVKEYLHVK